MDELEFRKRVYSNPDRLDQETLAAASANPDFQRILEQTRELNAHLREVACGRNAPEGLRERLLAIPYSGADQTAGEATRPARSSHLLRYYAIAACLLVAVGISISLPFNRGPSAAEMAFGNEVIAHIYHESAELEAIAAGTLRATIGMGQISDVLASAGSRLGNTSFLQDMPVRYANPCEIATPFKSAHLILESASGAINIITINNSPVSQEFAIGDDRFSGLVIPMRGGNLVLITEKNQDPGAYRSMVESSMEWLI